jgi:aldose 1-epimerase
MAITGQQFEICSGQYRCVVSEVGAGLAGLWRGSRAVTVPYTDDALPPMSNGGVLIPWPNRIRGGRYAFQGSEFQLPLSEPARGNASHGLTRWVRWNIAERDESSLTFVHDLVPQTGYPFELHFQVRYTVTGEDGLAVHARASNVGVRSAPFGAGFHPYFDLDAQQVDRAEVLVPAASVLIVDDQLIPVGKQPVAGTEYDLQAIRAVGRLRVDHGFADLSGSHAYVDIEDHRSELWWDDAFQFLQVYTPDPALFGRTAIAIEPMTCPANAFNSKEFLQVLEPGQEWLGSWGIRSYPKQV